LNAEIIGKIPPKFRFTSFWHPGQIPNLGTQQKITAPFHLIRGRNAQFLFIRRIFPEDLFLTGSLNATGGIPAVLSEADCQKMNALMYCGKSKTADF
jgi:hypothetical protein